MRFLRSVATPAPFRHPRAGPPGRIALAALSLALAAPLARAAGPTETATVPHALLDDRYRNAACAASSADIEALKAHIAERDARIEALLRRIAELSPPNEPNAPTISVSDVAVALGQRSVVVPVTLSEPTNHTVTARWSTANGAGTYHQFVASGGWLTWQPGERVKTLTVALTRDITAAQNIQVNIVAVPGYPGSAVAKRRGLISGGASASAAPAVPDTIALPARPVGKSLTWLQDFAEPTFCFSDSGKGADGRPCWQSRPKHGNTQDGNKELGLYASPERFPNITFTGLGPDGKRFIQLERHPEGFSEGGKPVLHAWDGKPFVYSSAMLQGAAFPAVIGEGSYVEARLRIDFVQGTWPAFWLMPASGAWPPEIDIFEGFWTKGRAAKDALTTTVHFRNRTGSHVQYGVDPALGTLLPGFDVHDWHVYGVLIEPDWLTYYIDDVPTVRTPNPTTRSARWYPLFDLTTGAAVGEPPVDAALPAKMGLDWLKVWN